MGLNMKLLFENSDLRNVTTSTFTRLSIIIFSHSSNYISSKIGQFITS